MGLFIVPLVLLYPLYLPIEIAAKIIDRFKTALDGVIDLNRVFSD